MENFDWTSFTKKIAIKASLNAIYDAWTKAAELEKWFLEKVSFFDANQQLTDRNQNVDADHTYEWFWYLYADSMKGKIVSANGKDKLQFTFEGNCLVNINLSQKDGYTIVELRHHNIPTDDYSKQYIRLGCSNGWHFYLTNLKSVFEGGLDLRNKDNNLNPMLNN